MSEGIVIAIIGSGSISAIVTAIIGLLQKKSSKKSAENVALMCLLDDRLGSLTEKYISRGAIKMDERRRLYSIHNAYKALGGNGYYAMVMEQIEKLPNS